MRSDAVSAVFDPVEPPTTLEETLDRLGTAIRLGLLPPGTRLPPERELAERLAISRSTLRQALKTLTGSGHLIALRGRTGGTFVAEAPPLAGRPPRPPESLPELHDYRIGIESGAVLLAVERAGEPQIAALQACVRAMRSAPDFATFRRADASFHIGLAEAAAAPRLVAATTAVQAELTEVMARVAAPPGELGEANDDHERLIEALRRRDGAAAVAQIVAHVERTSARLAQRRTRGA